MNQQALIDPPLKKSARISACKRYRWTLERWWGQSNRHVVFIMCNPSTADYEKDDPTLLTCIHFAKLWGYDGLKVVNLFPFRSSKPTECRDWYQHWDLRSAWDVRDIMQTNISLVTETAKTADLVIAAWGNIPWDDGIADMVASEIVSNEEPWPDLYCLGTTKSGSPKHPLARGTHRIPRDQQPVLWMAA